MSGCLDCDKVGFACTSIGCRSFPTATDPAVWVCTQWPIPESQLSFFDTIASTSPSPSEFARFTPPACHHSTSISNVQQYLKCTCYRMHIYQSPSVHPVDSRTHYPKRSYWDIRWGGCSCSRYGPCSMPKPMRTWSWGDWDPWWRISSSSSSESKDSTCSVFSSGMLSNLRFFLADWWIFQLDQVPMWVDIDTRISGALYLRDHKVKLGTIGMEVGEALEVFGFAEKDG